MKYWVISRSLDIPSKGIDGLYVVESEYCEKYVKSDDTCDEYYMESKFPGFEVSLANIGPGELND